MDFKRILKHLMTTERHVRKIFTPTHLEHIAHSIQTSERQHSGEIRFAVESALELQTLLDKATPRQRAIEVFSELHVWDTELNNGVLIYVLLADHAIEIVADRGIHAKVGTQYWDNLCKAIETAFAKGHYEEGVKTCVAAVSEKLIQHFPHDGGGENELPDTPVVIA
ncbi:MAG: TPM domain-containing protein [Limnobacter sp.]|uniref:TPM domain-containing protein n=1 Tax=Limnobacter sp. TaxID=2003368 RepID=UPI0032EEE281